MNLHPGYALALDTSALGALLWWRPGGAACRVMGGKESQRLRGVCVVAIWCLVGIPFAFRMGSYRSASLTETGTIVGDAESVVLEPEQWVGKRFPLVDYIDIGQRLAAEKWIVVLYHDDCPACKQAIPKYEELARGWGRELPRARIALIQVRQQSGCADPLVSPDSPCVLGHLMDVKDWFVTAPVEVRLDGGIVKKVVVVDASGRRA